MQINFFPPLFGGRRSNAILDSNPAAAAYGFRSLRSGYSGPVVRVRRWTDNLEQDFGLASGFFDTAPLSSFVGYDNFLLQSEGFENTNWVRSGSVAPPSVVANQSQNPFGDQTADLISFPPVSGAGRYSFIYQNRNNSVLTPNTVHTFSCYLRGSSGGEVVYLMWTNSITYARTRCELTTSWQRFSVTFTSSGGTGVNPNFLQIGIDLRDSAQLPTGVSQNIFAWGAQVSRGATPQSYQATLESVVVGTGSVVTWYDHSGNNRHLIQSIGSAQPLIYTSGALITRGGRPALFCSDTSQRLTRSTPGINYQNHFIASVVEFPSVTSDLDWYGTGNVTNGNILLMNFSRTTPPRAFRGHVFGTTTNSVDFQLETQPNTRYLFSQVQSVPSNIYTIYRNGTQSTTTQTANTVSGGNPSILNLGGRTGGGAPSRYYQEVIVWDNDQFTNVAAIHANMNAHHLIY